MKMINLTPTREGVENMMRLMDESIERYGEQMQQINRLQDCMEAGSVLKYSLPDELYDIAHQIMDDGLAMLYEDAEDSIRKLQGGVNDCCEALGLPLKYPTEEEEDTDELV